MNYSRLLMGGAMMAPGLIRRRRVGYSPRSTCAGQALRT